MPASAELRRRLQPLDVPPALPPIHPTAEPDAGAALRSRTNSLRALPRRVKPLDTSGDMRALDVDAPPLQAATPLSTFIPNGGHVISYLTQPPIAPLPSASIEGFPHGVLGGPPPPQRARSPNARSRSPAASPATASGGSLAGGGPSARSTSVGNSARVSQSVDSRAGLATDAVAMQRAASFAGRGHDPRASVDPRASITHDSRGISPALRGGVTSSVSASGHVGGISAAIEPSGGRRGRRTSIPGGPPDLSPAALHQLELARRADERGARVSEGEAAYLQLFLDISNGGRSADFSRLRVAPPGTPYFKLDALVSLTAHYECHTLRLTGNNLTSTDIVEHVVPFAKQARSLRSLWLNANPGIQADSVAELLSINAARAEAGLPQLTIETNETGIAPRARQALKNIHDADFLARRKDQEMRAVDTDAKRVQLNKMGILYREPGADPHFRGSAMVR